MTPGQTSFTRKLRFGSDLNLRRKFMVVDEPVKANVRAGVLLEVLDTLAEDTALQYVRQFYPEARVVTAAVDQLSVYHPPDITKDMVLRARINHVGRTSMEVGVRIEEDSPERHHISSCYFTMVARLTVDGEDKSVPLPPLEYPRPVDQKRRDEAVARREAHRENPYISPPTAEEYAMLRELHERQDANPGNQLLVSGLVTSGWERTYPEHENVPKKIFGGYVAHRMFMYANICAELVTEKRAVMVAGDRIDFYQPVRMGDKLHFISRVTYTGGSSIAVETSITRISRDRSVTALCNTCAFTFVHVDNDLSLLPVPEVYPTTYSEDARYLAGYRRRLAHSKRLREAAIRS